MVYEPAYQPLNLKNNKKIKQINERDHKKEEHLQYFLIKIFAFKGIASMSMTLAELYEKKKSTDGFLYMSYASQGYLDYALFLNSF